MRIYGPSCYGAMRAQWMRIVLVPAILAFTRFAFAAPPDNPTCARIGDLVTVRGAFLVAPDGKPGILFIPHAFPYRPFCYEFTPPAESEKMRKLGRLPLPSTTEGYMEPAGVPRNSLPIGKYVEVTGRISLPTLGPGGIILRPSITISMIVDIDAEVRAAIDVWLAGCDKWQVDNLPDFSKRVPGAQIERVPVASIMRQRLNQNILWTPADHAAQCVLYATPVSRVIVPPPQPVILVRPEVGNGSPSTTVR